MSLLKKLKIKFDFTSIQLFSSVSAQLSFAENHLLLKITDKDTFANKTLKKEIIKTLFKPIFQEDDTIFINYALIYKVLNLSNIKIKIDLFHPNKPDPITIEVYNIVESGIFRNKKLTTDQILEIETFLNNKKIQGSKRMIDIIDNFLYCLKDGMSNEGIVSNLEDKFYDSMAESKKYYQKAINDLKKTDQIKIDMKKKIYEKERQSKQYSKNHNVGGNRSHIKSNSMNLDNSIHQAKSIFNSFNECDFSNIMDTIIDEDDDKNYSTYESIFFELKKNSIQFLETTIFLFFQILDLEKRLLNLNTINKHNVSKGLKLVKHYETINNSINNDKKITNIDSNKFDEKTNINYEKKNFKKNKNFYSENVSSSDKQIVYNSNYTNNQVIINMNLCNEDRKIENKNIKINNNEEGIVIQITLEDTKENKFDSLLKNQSITNLSSSDKSKANLKIIEKNKQNYQEETPKFLIKPIPPLEPLCNKNSSNYLNNANKGSPQQKQVTQMIVELNKKVEEIKKNHMFFPPNDYMNIIHNTTEISHRKFYQKCFEDYFSKVFTYENDRYGFIKIESIISYFYYIKGLKNFLFNDANKIFYANIIFYEDD